MKRESKVAKNSSGTAEMISASFSIRSADSRDANAVSELLRASYSVLMKPAYEAAVLGPALKLMTRANPLLLSSGTYYVAESSGGDLVGCGGWTHEPPGGGVVVSGVGHLRHFAVHPNWTRRGVGSAIYRLCQAEARAAGVQRFECQASLNALDFYSALGFRRAAVVDIQMAPDVLIKGCEMYCEI